MFKTLLGDITNGRLKRLQYLGYSLLLDALMLGFGLAIVLAIGAGEQIIGGNLQLAQDRLREWFTVPFFMVFIPISLLFLFAGLNIMAKRIRDTGLPGWWSILIILVLEFIASFVFSGQYRGGLYPLIWLALLLIPTDSFA